MKITLTFLRDASIHIGVGSLYRDHYIGPSTDYQALVVIGIARQKKSKSREERRPEGKCVCIFTVFSIGGLYMIVNIGKLPTNFQMSPRYGVMHVVCR